MPKLPSGTVTFVFSDIEGSTTLLKQLGDAAYAEVLQAHRRLVRETFARYNGQEIDTQGDAFFYSFPRAREAVSAAVTVQRAHQEEAWPQGVAVRLRLGLHTGEPAIGEDGYTGLDVVRASRIAAVGRGGQVLLSETTRALVAGNLPEGVTLRSLGEQRLRDIDQPEPLHELRIPDVPVSPEPRPDASVPVRVDRGLPEEAVSAMPRWLRGAAARMIPSTDRMSQMIEERVLAELDRSLADDPDLTAPPRGSSRSSRRAGPPARPGPPARERPPLVSDEIAKLRALREEGALSEEQYEKAVDRVVRGER
jgi:class 3 adenylate cyclase